MLIKDSRTAAGQTDERTAMVETLLLALNTTAEPGTAWYGTWEHLSGTAVEDGKLARVNLWLLRDEVAREAGWIPPVDEQTEDMRQFIRTAIAEHGLRYVRKHVEEVAVSCITATTDARTHGDIVRGGHLDQVMDLIVEEVTRTQEFLGTDA